jgi:hypothetical protein
MTTAIEKGWSVTHCDTFIGGGSDSAAPVINPWTNRQPCSIGRIHALRLRETNHGIGN